MGIHRPADDHSGEDVKDDRQIEPALARPGRRDIGHPLGIGHRGSKFPVEQVGRDRLLVFAIGGAGPMLAWLRTQSQLTHQPGDALLPARLAFDPDLG